MALRRSRAVVRLLRAVAHGLHGLGIVLFRFPRQTAVQRLARIRWWSREMLRVLGIELRVEGAPLPDGGLLAVNHISWLDIMVVHALVPEARFVSKADVKAWPLISRLVDSAGTLYLERERKRDALRVVHAMAEALAAKQTVAIFPEGTTSTGHGLLPFHANLLQAAIATESPVQPVVLRYSDARTAFSPAATYVGDTSLAESVWSAAMADGLQVHLQIETAQATRHLDRRALAESLRQLIAQRLAAVR